MNEDTQPKIEENIIVTEVLEERLENIPADITTEDNPLENNKEGKLDVKEVDTDSESEEVQAESNGLESLFLDKLNAMEEKMESFSKNILSEFSSKLKIDEHKDSIIDKLHRDLDKYKNDFARKLLSPTFMELILLYDDVMKSLTRIGDDKEKAFKELESLPLYITDALENLGVNYYGAEEGKDLFSARIHKIVEVIPISDKSLDRIVVKVTRKGFVYEDKVLRVAMVKVYKYDENIVEDSIDTQEDINTESIESTKEGTDIPVPTTEDFNPIETKEQF